MTAVPRRTRCVPVALLMGTLLYGTAGCGGESSPRISGGRTVTAGSKATWEEPASYTYTLTSSAGERMLLGTFEVTVRDGKVREAVGLDDSARRVVQRAPGEVPTIGELLGEWEQAGRDHAHKAEVEYATDGRPVRMALDWEKDAVDDEALYVIGSFEPAVGQGPSGGSGRLQVTAPDGRR